MSRTSQTPYLYQPSSWFEPLQWDDVFQSGALPVHVDLGAGDGGFVRARARNHPEMNFLAVERLMGRVRKIARGALRENLENVRALRIEATYAAQYLFPKHSLSGITILFPDPWPKRRHHKNRLIQPSLLECCARALHPRGWIAIKTDDASYFTHIQKALAVCKSLRVWTDVVPSTLLPETTDFERDFLKEGRPVYFLAARPL